jgi:hypothetical protein
VRTVDGHPIILKVSVLDWRDHLDFRADGSLEEWSISNGRVLELWFGDAWVPVRYEAMHPSWEHRVWLYFDHPDGGDGMELNRASMRFRWPQQSR